MNTSDLDPGGMTMNWTSSKNSQSTRRVNTNAFKICYVIEVRSRHEAKQQGRVLHAEPKTDNSSTELLFPVFKFC